ncbi:MAG: endosialidase [Eubacteriales bacterium]
MAVLELLRGEENNTISFGNHQLDTKAKVENYEHCGDIYKVKTFRGMTKLEKNGMFLYESVPGTSVHNLEESEQGVCFIVEGRENTEITLGLEDSTEYEVFLKNINIGKMKTSIGGKLNISVELEENETISVQIKK